jgi:hypothetical protein
MIGNAVSEILKSPYFYHHHNQEALITDILLCDRLTALEDSTANVNRLLLGLLSLSDAAIFQAGNPRAWT